MSPLTVTIIVAAAAILIGVYVSWRAGRLHPRVQPVEPARPPGHVDPDQDRGGYDDDRDGQRAHGTTSTLPVAGVTAWYTCTTSLATTGQS